MCTRAVLLIYTREQAPLVMSACVKIAGQQLALLSARLNHGVV